MAYQFKEIEQNIFLIECTGEVTMQEFEELTQESAKFASSLGFESNKHIVIFDMRKAFLRDLNISTLLKGASLPPVPECTIILPNPSKQMTNSIARFVLNLAKQNLLIATSYDHALKLAEKRLDNLRMRR